ncbi:uncharacterized protein LOC128984992 [Macrosteles quadrilineatus]|uniref:uncharacterized protein LOC128984992 n=1 Tax=Macrosteles quadrilineatus TaxID=74068 RepID=UPI0023E0A653|nr:uncharacterized protein LOC128984992 [Macrosteles quadrilineatus]
MAYTCVASGSFHQGDSRFTYSRNAQCVANSACAIAWKSLGKEFSTFAIDSILLSGDALYRSLRNEGCVGGNRFLFPDEIPHEFTVAGNEVRVDISYVYDALYPVTRDLLDDSIAELACELELLFVGATVNVGFLFTGLNVTVGFWHSQDKYFLFDPHAVNEHRQHDISIRGNNLARLFACDSYISLASLLLCNVVYEANAHQYSITQLKFDSHVASASLDFVFNPVITPLPSLNFTPTPHCPSPEFLILNDSINESLSQCPSPDFLQDPKLNTLYPVVVISPLRKFKSLPNLETPRKGPGRPKKLKRGRPKVLNTTKDEQIAAAKKKYTDNHPDKNVDDACRHRETHPDSHREAVRIYSQSHPEVNREAVGRYSQTHPEVNREAVGRYSQTHPEVNREAVQRYSQTHPEVNREAVGRYSQKNPDASRQRVAIFRLKNPMLSELRHLPAALARHIFHHGPMGSWEGELLNNIPAFNLNKISLWDDSIFKCSYCGARLFEEEKGRKKWCCGQGANNVLNLQPLQESFYSDRRFLDRARAYNDMFAFCALELSGGYRHPSGLSFFKIEGRMYHQVYNLSDSGQKFTTKAGDVQFVNRSRMYIDDGEERRNIALGRSLDGGIIDLITRFLSQENPYIVHYRRLGSEPAVNAHLDFQVTSRATHGPILGDRQTGVEVHAVLSTEETVYEPRKLTIWKVGSGRPSSINLFSPLMEPFQYPLLYPHGTLGWHIGRLDNFNKKLSQYDYSRCLLLSDPRFSHLGRLSQAWQVEMYARYEEERLNYIKFTQTKSVENAMRIGPLDEVETVTRGGHQAGRQVLNDIANDETVQGEGGIQAGKVYLPSSFTGGPRYMKLRYENAMALVSRLGFPTFFLTFTYSATWEENKRACPRGSGRSDPSTACRVFYIKLLELLRDLRSGAMFGRSVYIVHVIEMQMRGLPHAHIVFKIEGDGPVQAADIDSIIRADIPSKEEAGGRLRALVLRHMVHGPCGTDHRTDFPCWDSDKGSCTKFFPKPPCETTHVDERGFVQYRRDYNNEGSITSRNRSIPVHDGWVVPYNSALLLKYEAHINLEVASTRRVIKYLFKYLMKGGSLQNVKVTPLSKQDDEVEHYVTKRMVGASDACWRLLDFPISKSEPTVECLPVHLEGKQNVCFRPNNLTHATSGATSDLIFYFNRPRDPMFDNLTYQCFFEQYIVHSKRPSSAEVYEHPDGKHFLTSRKRGQKICRLFWVSPNRSEQYFLRLLLMIIPCRGYADLLARGGDGCTTFQQVARTLGLVEDEDEYHQALKEAARFMVGPRLRSFFVLLCNMGAPAALLWDAFRDTLCEDHLERNPLDHDVAFKLGLIEIDRSLRRQGSCLADHGLPIVDDDTTELGRELLIYGENQQRSLVDEWEPKLSNDQRVVFDYVRSILHGQVGSRSIKLIFLDGPGGYGKTFLIHVILAYVRSLNRVAIAVASSGIAAGSLPGGTTAHSMFRLPLDLGDGTGYWNLTNGSQRAELIRAAQLIVFDEAPMAHRYIFEIIDRSLRNLMNSPEPFGNKIFLCCGDFRQIAPVVAKARTPADIACVSLCASSLWSSFKIFSLSTPHRTSGSTAYSEFLLKVGNGTIRSVDFEEGRGCSSLIPLSGIRYVTSLHDLVDFVFPVCDLSHTDRIAGRAILSTMNTNVQQINNAVLNLTDGFVHELRSADSVDKEHDDGMDVDVHLLNQATGKGVPDHVLRLKIGSVCLVMRNLNIDSGLVNGTKVIVTAIRPRLITVRLPGQRDSICIPRIQFVFPFVEGSPLRVRRLQFPLMLAYSMTGHKSQGQTIDRVGVDLRSDCFTHGQLYVLLSRVRHPDDIVVLVHPDRVHEGVAYAKNIVYDELLR